MAAHRGRKRKPDAQRRKTTLAERSGGPQRNDHIIEQRIRLHGMPEIGTEHPLDILAAKGMLTTDTERHDRGLDHTAINSVRRDAGRDLAELHGRIHGPNAARAQDVNRGSRSTSSAEPTQRDEITQSRYMAMRATLHGCGRAAMDAVYNVAVYKRPLPRHGADTMLQCLRVGLAALAGEGETATARRPMRVARLEETVG